MHFAKFMQLIYSYRIVRDIIEVCLGVTNVFSQRLRELRKERRLTAKEFGEKFSLAESTISGYETKARKPDMELVERFADFFEVSVDYLLGRTNIRNTANPVHEEPVVQVLMRGKDQMSSKNYELFTKAVEELKKAYMDKVDRELDGDK